ncbi:hypothetical protein QSH14_01810 [Proteus faecis]|uniref:Lipoprotein n=1 Tax=Proteus faecis TaxID=2050967 RepID=A0AAW7CJ72_9GAMM|nr:hypothetical protein [Proteus faecis]MDL5165823.1 hypothetical protein [Proteus faecis]MDL5273913.1 hypothetical protein [Proteus faecis]MDL5277483.1 hypothetical protein [Proteus faecis]MDL5306472.1 hypothetical protein [Proteus faecis]MDL5310040.1 hypothetical protein [Proteus faecis]
MNLNHIGGILLVTLLSGCTTQPATTTNKQVDKFIYDIDDKFNINEQDKKYFVPKKQAHILETVEEIKNANCSYYMNSTGIIDIPIDNVKVTPSSFKKGLLFDNSYTECSLRQDYRNKDFFKIEMSERALVNGVKVTIRHSSDDGTFIVGGGIGYGDHKTWVGHCSKDAMTDNVSCVASNGNFMIMKIGGKYTSVIVGDIYPGEKSYIRIDGEKPHSSIIVNQVNYFDNLETKKIMKEMESHSLRNKAITQYISWPERRKVNEDIDISYISVVKEVLDTVYDNF